MVEKVEDALCSDDEANSGVAGEESLARVCHCTAVYQVDKAVGEHFGVNSEVFMVFEERQSCVRDGADTCKESVFGSNIMRIAFTTLHVTLYQ